MPAFVEREFRAYLGCRVLAHGFARARGSDCGQERLVAFSCTARGVCPSCTTRRIAEVAAHLTDRVLRTGSESLPPKYSRLMRSANPVPSSMPPAVTLLASDGATP